MGISFFANAKEVTVSIVPQKFFVEKIAQDKIKVNVMVKPGFSPATYEPKTSQMKRLAESLVYFSIGVPFEQVWLERFASSNKSMKIVDTSVGIEKLAMVAHTHHDEEHEHEKHEDEEHHEHDSHEKEAHHDEEHEHEYHDHDKKEHDHDEHHDHEKHEKEVHHDEHEGHHHEDGLDPHIWLDPILVKQQAKVILETLVSIDVNNKAFYEKNYQAFITQLDQLHNQLEELLHDSHDKAFMVFHPSWGYFAKRYDLEQIAVEKEGKEPKPKELTQLIEEAELHNIKVVFVAPQFSQKAAKVIAQSVKGDVVFIDPLAYDYYNNLMKVAKSIKKSYQ